MFAVAPRPTSRRLRRRHRLVGPGDRVEQVDRVDQADRAALEQAGWRTMLEYRENLVRSPDGTLVAVLPRWTAEAELHVGVRPVPSRVGPRVLVRSATGDDPAAAWAELRRQVASCSDRPDVTQARIHARS